MFNKYILFLWPWSGSFGWVVIGLTALPVVLRCSTACEAVKPCFPFSQVKPLMLPLGRSDKFELVFSTQIWFDPAHLRSFPKLSRNICAPCVSSCHLKIHTYIHICLFKVCLFIFSYIYICIYLAIVSLLDNFMPGMFSWWCGKGLSHIGEFNVSWKMAHKPVQGGTNSHSWCMTKLGTVQLSGRWCPEFAEKLWCQADLDESHQSQ